MKQVLNTAPRAYSEVLGDSPVGAGSGVLQGGKGGTSERRHGGGHTETPGALSDATGKDGVPDQGSRPGWTAAPCPVSRTHVILHTVL